MKTRLGLIVTFFAIAYWLWADTSPESIAAFIISGFSILSFEFWNHKEEKQKKRDHREVGSRRQKFDGQKMKKDLNEVRDSLGLPPLEKR